MNLRYRPAIQIYIIILLSEISGEVFLWKSYNPLMDFEVKLDQFRINVFDRRIYLIILQIRLFIWLLRWLFQNP